MGTCLEMPSAMLGIKTQRDGSMELFRFFLREKDEHEYFLSKLNSNQVQAVYSLFY